MCKRSLALATCLALCGCELFGHHFSKHPDDVEMDSAPLASTGACDGAPRIDPASLFDGPYSLAIQAPPEGSRVAVDGRPVPMLICTQLGCAWECCDNACGDELGCTYTLPAGPSNELCLDGEGFACGGTDCSPWCKPFSTEPEHSYRFIGTLRYEQPGRAWIEIERFCRHDD
ncbi:MAG: hypothetical protein JXR96_31235 [Deltaproteobacteria bacterium]|nr:hypothetical protein [Deltaproteobacteria bacterium]